MLAGIVAGVLCGRFVDVSPWIMAGTALALGAVAQVVRRPVAVEMALASSLGIVSVTAAMPRQFCEAPDGSAVITGCVRNVSFLAELQRIRVHVTPADGDSYDMLLTYPAFEPRIEPGDSIRFSGSYSLPRRLTDMPLESDMSDYYFNNGISLLCFVPKGNLAVTGRGGDILAAMLRWRDKLVDRICGSGLDGQAATFLAAVLAGDDSLLAPGLRDDYATAGVAHLLALSGAHVAMIAMVLAILLFPLTLAGYRRARWWLTIAALVAYMLFTGMSPSVCRAVIMASGVLLALVFDRPRSSLNLLCLAAALILLFSPLSLMNAGFQLSFAATLAIILFTPALAPVSLVKRSGGSVAATMASTLAATAGTVPLVAYHFHAVPLYFFIANIAAVAVMPVLIGGGVSLSLLMLAGMEPGWLLWIINTAYSAFDSVVTWVAGLPGASAAGIYIDAWLLVPLYIALAFVVARLYLGHRSYTALVVATLLFAAGVYGVTQPRYATGEAYMLRSHRSTSIACHQGDTLRILTTSPVHNHSADSAAWHDRYRDYIATRGIRHVDVCPLDSVAAATGGRIRFGSRYMVIAHAFPHRLGGADVVGRSDYLLITAGWYGDPVALGHWIGADTIVISMDMNSRRRHRYMRELQAAEMPAVDLADRPLMSF